MLGVFCFLEYSKHNKDKNIKLIVYKNEFNLYQLDDDQKNLMVTVFPHFFNKEYIQEDNTVTVCKELKRLTSHYNLKIDDVNKINKTYGSYLYVDKNKLSVCEHIIVESVYDLDVSKLNENDKNELKEKNEIEKINYLSNKEIIKITDEKNIVKEKCPIT